MNFWGNHSSRALWSRQSGIHIESIAERPSGIDERLAAIFRDMRLGLGASPMELARALDTTPEVIEALESGRVHAFPRWPETVRIVSELGGLHRVDARPILARIRDQVGPVGLGQAPAGPRTSSVLRMAEHPSVRASGRHVAQARAGEASRGGRQSVRRQARRAATALFALTPPVILIGGAMWMAQAHPSIMLRAVGAFPEPIVRVLRPAAEYLVVQMAPRREGLRWIEVNDPRTRKSDKLRQASR